MKIAFCLFKYSPYSGLSLDFLRILEECQKRGHDTHVFVSEWQGERPEGVPFNLLRPRKYASTNHGDNKRFYDKLKIALDKTDFDIVVGFDKMPGLDVYYGADSCYLGRTVPQYPAIYKITPRYKSRYSFEEAVFGLKSKTLILSLSERQKSEYQEHYFTPNERFHLLPPTLDASFSPIKNRAAQKALAEEVTLTVHGQNGLHQAKKVTDAFFGGDISDLTADQMEDVLDGSAVIEIGREQISGKGIKFSELTVLAGAGKSVGDVRRTVEQGGMYLNGRKITEAAHSVSINDLIEGRILVIRRGRKSYYLVKIAK